MGTYLSIINSIQAHFWSEILDSHPWHSPHLVVADTYHEDVRSLPLAIDRQLGKHGCQLWSERRAAGNQ